MPTYPYECPKCKVEFEKKRKISDPPLRECPTEGCDGEPNRLIGQTSFVLNGQGWFKSGGY
jgi:putative FmdB family regulatory protein